MRRFSGSTLLIATHNSGKLEEIRDLFQQRPFEIVSAAEMGLPVPLETETSFIGNARLKAHAAARSSGLVSLADDSGLCVAALDGQPGVYTADWAEGPGGRDFGLAMARVCRLLDQASVPAPRTAKFVCTFALAWPDGYDECFSGEILGQIVCPGRGNLGHGYDPIFQADGFDITFGEMDRWKKNRVSHRAAAFAKLAACFT